MATTSGRIAAAVVDAIAESNSRFAILHGADEIREFRAASDLDLVTGEPPLEFLARNWSGLREIGMLPVLLWPNDEGATTAFLSSEDALEGVQLDMMFDPTG
jgi:hypothetical protein